MFGTGAPIADLYVRVAQELGGHIVSVDTLAGGVSAPTRLVTYEKDGAIHRVVVRSASRFPRPG